MGKPAKLTKALRNRIVGHGEEQVDQMLANPLNFRLHPDNQQQALAGSIDDIGFIRSVTVNRRTGRVVDGHLRVTIAARSNVESLPVEYVDLDEAEEAQALLSLDPIAALAASDKQKLDELMHAVQSDDARVQQMMADLAEREGLEYGKKEKQDDPGAQVDKAEELREKWQVEPGQLWQLGEHRLICGDCTDKAVVDRLMGGEKADICVTDPPYGVLDEKWDRLFVQSDLNNLLNNSTGLVAIFNSAKTEIIKSILSLEPTPERMGVWRYSQIAPKPGMIWSWQPVFYWRCGKAVAWDSLDWYQGNSDRDGTHPTQKPVAFFEKIIGSVDGVTVYEPFCGSGTTLIACENLKRKCRAVEISPAYVAVALERWSTMTGQTPTLLGTEQDTRG